ncbi:thymidylate kinase [Streptomyces sp. NPDC058701]|uniref:thymidylate kinase n=1 Tax=Streptomyces sp. NPDC058701 TaxID=3346608 RepID=UPI00365A6FAF
MSNATVPRPRPGDQGAGRPLWVSVEGINGIGKTSAVQALAAACGARCLSLAELTDQAADSLPGQVIAALATGGDAFLRTGHPVAETLALLALKVREYERLESRRLVGVDFVLEDRGVDSVAVYQAAILAAGHAGTQPQAVAGRILAAAARWRPLPDATVLMVGDRAAATARFAARTGRTLAPRDLAVIDQADRLYRDVAAADPGRFTVLDVTGHHPAQSAGALHEAVQQLLARREAAHAP